MNTQRIEVAKIVVPEVRVTAVYDTELQELLKSTMQTMGMVQPIVVVQSGERYILVDGVHRLQEKVTAGDKEIDAVLLEGDDKKALLANLVLNRTRGKTKASEMVKVIGSLYNDFKMDSDAIRDETGLTREYIEKLLIIARASPAIMELLDQEVIGVGVAYHIARLPTQIQQEKLCAQARIYAYTVEDAKKLVDDILFYMAEMKANPLSMIPPPVAKFVCEACQQEVLPHYLRPILICPACFGKVWDLIQESGLRTTGVVKKPEEGVGG